MEAKPWRRHAKQEGVTADKAQDHRHARESLRQNLKAPSTILTADPRQSTQIGSNSIRYKYPDLPVGPTQNRGFFGRGNAFLLIYASLFRISIPRSIVRSSAA
jgi:hypothetical protein